MSDAGLWDANTGAETLGEENPAHSSLFWDGEKFHLIHPVFSRMKRQVLKVKSKQVLVLKTISTHLDGQANGYFRFLKAARVHKASQGPSPRSRRDFPKISGCERSHCSPNQPKKHKKTKIRSDSLGSEFILARREHTRL